MDQNQNKKNDVGKPHIRLEKDNITSQKKVKHGFSRKIPFSGDYSERSKELIGSLRNVYDQSLERDKRFNSNYMFFKIIFSEKVSEKNLMKLNIDLLQIPKENEAIGSLDKKDYLYIIDKLLYKNKDGNKGILESLESILPIDPKDKISHEVIKSIEEHKENLVEIQIELYPKLGEQYYKNTIKSINEYLKKISCETTSSYYNNKYARIKGKISSSAVEDLVDDIEPIEKIEMVKNYVLDMAEGDSTIPTNGQDQISDKNNPIVCVIDSGIDRNHPLLKNLIIDVEDYSKKTNDGVDNVGHGTFVAGLVAYRHQFDNSSQLVPHCNIVAVKVIDSKEGYIELEEMLESCVQKYVDRVKVYNLSMNREINNGLCSELAEVIDNLEREYGVLFTISAGNIKAQKLNDYYTNGVSYPAYFSRGETRILCPGESCNSITVGSIALKESPNSIAPKNQPSPFTRPGYSSDGRIKPDLVEHGGNLALNKSGLIYSIIREKGIEIKSINCAKKGGGYCYKVGTSFSTPLVASLAAELFKRYPDATPNLVKALLINSSIRHNTGWDTNLCGYGRPNNGNALYSYPHKVTYMAESSINMKTEQYVKFRIPTKMGDIKGIKRLILTLVYDPPVDHDVFYYSLVDLEVKMIKGGGRDNTYQTPSSPNWVYRRMEDHDNVKIGVFEWSNSGYGTDWKIKITPSKKESIKDDFEQKYAVVMTLEDPTKRIDLYNSVLNELNLNIQTRSKARSLMDF